MAAILVTADQYETIGKLIRCLRRQTVREKLEVIIVSPSRGRSALRDPDLEGFAGYRFVECNDMTSISRARALGIGAAHAPVVALTEAHCFPDPQWAEALIERHREPWAGVGPAICNATI